MSVANDNYDFSHFSKWYDQAGTPLLKITDQYVADKNEYHLTIQQTNKPTAGQDKKIPLFMPFKIGLLDGSGKDMSLTCTASMPQLNEGVLHISKEDETFVFTNVSEKPTLSLNRDFSAPVNIEYNYSEEELAFLMSNDSDAVARYNASQMLFEKVLLNKIEANSKGSTATPSAVFYDAIKKAIKDADLDNELKAMALRIPSHAILAQKFEVIDYLAIHEAISSLSMEVANECKKEMFDLYDGLDLTRPYEVNPKDVGERAIANLLVSYLGKVDSSEFEDLLNRQYSNSNNMTSKLGAFRALVHNGCKSEEMVSKDFYNSHKSFDASLQEWMRCICSDQRSGALGRIKKVMEIPEFDITIPNHVYASIRIFGANYNNFHAEDGSGYKFMADRIIEIDKLNSQVAAGLATSFKQYAYLNDHQSELMKAELKRVKNEEGLTKGTYEIIEKTLNSK
jgi:aminopeptidase N